MNIHRRVIITQILILAFASTYQIEISAQKSYRYSLESLIQIAQNNYLRMDIKKGEIAQKRELYLHEKQWQNPEAGISMGGKKTGNEWGLDYSVNLSQKLPVSGKKGIAAAIAMLEEREARVALEELKLALRYEIIRLSYTYTRNLMKSKHIKDRLGRIKLINAYMQGHILVSPQRIVERNIVREKLSRMEMELLDISKSLTLSYNALNHYLKFPSGESFKIDLSWFSRAPEMNLKDLLSQAMTDNFSIRYQEVALAKAEYGVDMAKRDIFPDIGLSLFYTGDTMKQREQVFGGGISMPLPILSQNRHAIEKEALNKKSQQLVSTYVKDTVTRRILELYAEYEYASGMIKLFPLSRLKALEEKMDYADEEFRKGRVTLASYLDMDTALHESIESVYESQLLLVRAYTELLFMAAIKKEVRGDLL